MNFPILNDIVIVFGLSIAVLYVFHLVKIPAIVGFLLTGVLAGPHGLGFINNVHDVETVAEIGVVLLLFTIGIELSLRNLIKTWKLVILGGFAQVGLTILGAFFVSKHFGLETNEAIFLGFLLALSSSAIVLKLFQERGDFTSPHGQLTLAILIFQDVAIVPMMLITPVLSGATEASIGSLAMLFFKGIIIIGSVLTAAHFLVPKLMYAITKTRSRELFLLAVLGLCFAVAWLTSSLGLSIALGAFLAGLIISESEYACEAMSSVVPFRDVFISIFFVSIGMLLDVFYVLKNPFLILIVTISVIFFKTLFASLTSLILRFPLRTTIIVGLSLSQVGEFSFILSKSGLQYGLIGNDLYQGFLAVSILTMVTAPILISSAPKIAILASKLPLPLMLLSGDKNTIGGNVNEESMKLKDHIIIIGFGLGGRNVAKAAGEADIPYVIIEMNPETVKKEREAGEHIIYGDAVNQTILDKAGIDHARVGVVVISDSTATKGIIYLLKKLNPAIFVIARTHFLGDLDDLYAHGADEVIAEEYETSIEIFSRVLAKYLVPSNEIAGYISKFRHDGYEMFRTPSIKGHRLSDLELSISSMEICSLRVSEGSPFVGKSLADIDLRRKHGVNLVAILRNSEVLPNPGGETVLFPKDIIIALGTVESINELSPLITEAI